MASFHVTFLYEEVEEKIKCSKDEIMLDIMERFADSKDKKADDFIFILDDEAVDKYTTYEKLFNIDNKKKILVYLNEIDEVSSNEIKIHYSIEKGKKYSIRIFGDKFVEKYAEKCKFVYKDTEKEICPFLSIEKEESNIIEIKLKDIKQTKDFSYMFCDCESLIFLPDIGNLKTTDVRDMSYMFYNCKNLDNLTNIQSWIIKNVENLSYMFYNCHKLFSIDYLSKWDTSKVRSMKAMFSGCLSLSNLADISKWDLKNVNDLSEFFSGCISLISIPDISLWDLSNVRTISNFFHNCNSLKSLPDISK